MGRRKNKIIWCKTDWIANQQLMLTENDTEGEWVLWPSSISISFLFTFRSLLYQMFTIALCDLEQKGNNWVWVLRNDTFVGNIPFNQSIKLSEEYLAGCTVNFAKVILLEYILWRISKLKGLHSSLNCPLFLLSAPPLISAPQTAVRCNRGLEHGDSVTVSPLWPVLWTALHVPLNSFEARTKNTVEAGKAWSWTWTFSYLIGLSE